MNKQQEGAQWSPKRTKCRSASSPTATAVVFRFVTPRLMASRTRSCSARVAADIDRESADKEQRVLNAREPTLQLLVLSLQHLFGGHCGHLRSAIPGRLRSEQRVSANAAHIAQCPTEHTAKHSAHRSELETSAFSWRCSLICKCDMKTLGLRFDHSTANDRTQTFAFDSRFSISFRRWSSAGVLHTATRGAYSRRYTLCDRRPHIPPESDSISSKSSFKSFRYRSSRENRLRIVFKLCVRKIRRQQGAAHAKHPNKRDDTGEL